MVSFVKMKKIFIILLLLTGCRKQSVVEGQWISPLEEQNQVTIPVAMQQSFPSYPWDERLVASFPKITKEFFRCKGSRLNPIIVQKKEGKEPLYVKDCNGASSHSLPLNSDQQEFVYPCLIDLLNYLQRELQNPVVITTGHRCPAHNRYADHSTLNTISKHMIAAEVDFYVKHFENQPLKVIKLIQDYYRHKYIKSEMTTFLRYEKSGLNVSTFPWYNQEIFIKLYLSDEGRDFDNQHPYPYIGIQVRYDQALHKPVTFDAKIAESFLRY